MHDSSLLRSVQRGSKTLSHGGTAWWDLAVFCTPTVLPYFPFSGVATLDCKGRTLGHQLDFFLTRQNREPRELSQGSVLSLPSSSSLERPSFSAFSLDDLLSGSHVFCSLQPSSRDSASRWFRQDTAVSERRSHSNSSKKHSPLQPTTIRKRRPQLSSFGRCLYASLSLIQLAALRPLLAIYIGLPAWFRVHISLLPSPYRATLRSSCCGGQRHSGSRSSEQNDRKGSFLSFFSLSV